MREIFISFDKVSKAFGALTVVDELDLAVGKGEFVSMLGPSGSGKTTILMMLAGFEKPTGGTISLAGRRIDTLPPHRRDMGVVFQNYALFPHMTVADNVAFPLRMRRVGKAEAEERVRHALGMVQLAALADRKPSQLSGGQQQRVALARALVFEPQVVLMDEPLGALDKKLREQMQLDIRELHRRLGLTIIFVTHDQTEALTMSDRIAVFNHGKIEQLGRPDEIYDRPSTRFVAEFIGETNFIAASVLETSGDRTVVKLANGQQINVHARGFAAGSDANISIRPERVKAGPGRPGSNVISGTVSDVVYHGDHLLIVLDANGQPFLIKSDRHGSPPQIGGRLEASFSPHDCWVVAG
jgi:putative spermidine/putrescine transport system ATP-binding protein